MRKRGRPLPPPDTTLRGTMFTTAQLVWFQALPENRQAMVLLELIDGATAEEALHHAFKNHHLEHEELPDDP